MVKGGYVPETGHLIKIDFDPRGGREPAGWRPAIVLSPASYNRPTGLAIVAPITNKGKGYRYVAQKVKAFEQAWAGFNLQETKQ